MTTYLALKRSNGSALAAVVIFSALLIALSYGILSWSRTEMRIDLSHKRRLVARNMAEALLEYGAANASLQVQQVTDYSNAFCDPSSSTTALPLPPAQIAADSSIDPSSLEIVGKVTAPVPNVKTDIKASDPSNTYSSLRTRAGKAGTLTLLARASTFPDPFGHRNTVYLRRSYTILDGPVLQYAAFYNMDLEVAPGPQLNVYGPVHTNANLWVSKQSSGASPTLDFWEQVTAVGTLRHGFKVEPIKADGSRETSDVGPVRFMTPSGTLVDLYGGSPAMWRDQYMGTTVDQSVLFRTFTNATYGNATNPSLLQTSAHGVLRRPLPGQLDNYVADPDPTDGIVDVTYRNVPRALIERPLKTGDAEYLGNEVEKQKMARKAGLYIIVNGKGSAIATGVRDPAGNDIPGGFLAGEYRAWIRDPDASTPSVPVYREVFLPGQPAFGAHAGHSFSGPIPLARPIIFVRPNQMVDMRRFVDKTTAVPTGFDYLLPRSATNIYQPKRINTIEVDMTALKKAVDKTVNAQATSMIFPYDSDNPAASPVENYYSTYRAAFADYGINVAGPVATSRTGLPTLTAADLIESMNAKDWDGSIYIESLQADVLLTAGVTTVNNPDPRPGYPLRRAIGHRGSGVRLINGRGPIVSANAARLAITTYPCSPGLTLSTNDALYILGHLNADGLINTPSSPPTPAQLADITTTDASTSGNNSSLFPDPKILPAAAAEGPLALVADAITILSQPTFTSNAQNSQQTSGWSDALSHLAECGINGANWSATWATSVPSSANSYDGGFGGATAATPQTGPVGTALYGSPLSQYIAPTPNSVPAGFANSPVKFRGAPTEISAGFIVGLTPSAKNPTSATNDGNNSGGLHNLPRFLENWNGTSAIRGSMVVMFESQVAWEPWSLRMYGPPTRLWGFHNLFRNFEFSDDIPATRNLGTSAADTFQLLTRDDYIVQRNAMWPSFTFPTTY